VAHASDPRLLVLHVLRLKGFAEPHEIADAARLERTAVDEQLAKLRADELAVRREGRLQGWTLTPAGRAEHERLVAEEASDAGATDVVRRSYERFLAVNPRLLAVCTDWQVRAGARNEHLDTGYDAAVLGRLRAVDDEAAPVLADLSAALDRYAGYAARLRDALGAVAGGRTEWLTKPGIDSYHTVWFELHEDLLSTLGLERSEEVVAP
jgi:DNA-binding MarR family transcriptional regulator